MKRVSPYGISVLLLGNDLARQTVAWPHVQDTYSLRVVGCCNKPETYRRNQEGPRQQAVPTEAYRRGTRVVLWITVKSKSTYSRPCKHDSLSVTEWKWKNTRFMSHWSAQNLRGHYRHWSPVFMTKWSKLAINFFLQKMVCLFLNFLISVKNSCLQNGAASRLLKLWRKLSLVPPTEYLLVQCYVNLIYPSVVHGDLILPVIRQKSCLDQTCRWAYHVCYQNCHFLEALPFISTTVSLHSASLRIVRLNLVFNHSLVNYFVSQRDQRNLEATKLLEPIIDARRNEEMKGGTEKPVWLSVYLENSFWFLNRKISWHGSWMRPKAKTKRLTPLFNECSA